ncbi:MAG: transposase, partial [Nostoc sp.]
HVNFRTKDCKNCAVRSQCTRAANDPRALTIQAQPDYEALQKGRERQKTEEFQKQYALCSGLTRADYLEHIVRHNASPCITREDSEFLAPHQEENEPQPSITRQKEFSLTSYPASERQSVALPRVVELEILRDAFGAA